MAETVSLELIGAPLERIFAELGTIRADQAAMHDGIRVLTAIVLRHENTLVDMLQQMRTMVAQHQRCNDRLRRLEEQPAQ